LFSSICKKRGDNLYIDWSNPWAAAFLEHELGHALGVGHDRSDGECSDFGGIMGKPVNYKGSLKPEYCSFVNHQNCDPSNGANCPKDPRVPDDPIGKLPDHCQFLPWLCNGDDPNNPDGNPGLWFHSLGGPSYECSVVVQTASFPDGTTFTISRGCYWLVARTPPEDPLGTRAEVALLPATEIVAGPRMKVLRPGPDVPVAGVAPVTGWAADATYGVEQLAFWLDGQPVSLGAFQYGTEQVSVCSDVADANCPNVGFEGELDTAGLGDGVHILEAASANARPQDPGVGYWRQEFIVDNTLPTASITAPSYGAAVSGSVAVDVSASDANGVHLVSFSIDGSYQATDSAAPYSFTWDTTTWSNGTHTLKAKVFDNAGNERDVQRAVTVSNDFETPQVAVTAPSAGSFGHGSIPLAAQATDNQGVTLVDFRVDGAVVGSDPAAPYQVSWDSTSVGDGPHTITARAYDGSGNVGVSAPVGITVDNTLPSLYVDSPSNLQSVEGASVKVSGWAIDASGIGSRSFAIDGAPVAVSGLVTNVNRQGVCDNHPEVGDPACPYVGWRAYFDSTAFPNGQHTLEVTVTDSAGNSKTFDRQLTIANPAVTLAFNPVADATAWQALPTYNNGTSTTLAVKTTNGGSGAYAFLKFQVSGVTGAVTGAHLRVFTLNPMTDLWLYWLVSSSWTETGLTWSNYPAPGGALDHYDNLVAGTWYSFDVSAYVTGNGTYSLGFANSNPAYADLWSRESSSKPVLEVTYQP
jgi:hypothetical protein